VRPSSPLRTGLLVLIFVFAIAVHANPTAKEVGVVEARLDHARELRLQGHTNQALKELRGLLTSLRGRPEFLDLELNVKSEMSEIYLSQNDLAQAAARNPQTLWFTTSWDSSTGTWATTGRQH
jgi:hypothetical protein